MTHQHRFIFQPKVWLGQGTISLSVSTEKVNFYTRWSLLESEDGRLLKAVQEIEMDGIAEVMKNHFQFRKDKANAFLVQLENPVLGEVSGKGLTDDKLIAWEFRSPSLEGFEVYELQEDGHYQMRAEYCSSQDEEHTVIQGRIWEQSALTAEEEPYR
ncbi:MAG: hypothetical protein L7U87_07870 [Chlamydiales bacterium]|nr:hypothetical protein [Chlamydiales bacterium]